MKRKITLTISVILLASIFLTAQTIVPAGAVEGTWTLSNSPYEIQGAIFVADSTTLTIEPGVVVKFNTTERFVIYGCLLAEGSEQDSILFTNYDPLIRWGGIKWLNTPSTNDSSKIAYCIFEHAFSYGSEVGLNSGAAIAVKDFNKLSILHSTFRFNKVEKPGVLIPSGGAIALWNASIYISHCIFHNNSAEMGGAIMIYNDSEAIIDNCLFFDNNVTTYGGAIEVYETDTSYFINCTFANNHSDSYGGAFHTYYSIPTLTNCILWDNTADVEGNQVDIYDNTSGLNIFHCDIQEGEHGFGGFHNNGTIQNLLDTVPEFMGEGALYPYAIDTSSACANYGTLDDSCLPENWNCPCLDLADLPRNEGSSIDLGAYETQVMTGTIEYENSQIINLNVFPNPTANTLTINFDLAKREQVNIQLYTLTGQLVSFVANQSMAPGKQFFNIDMSNIPNGYYLLKLHAGNMEMTKKVIKY